MPPDTPRKYLDVILPVSAGGQPYQEPTRFIKGPGPGQIQIEITGCRHTLLLSALKEVVRLMEIEP